MGLTVRGAGWKACFPWLAASAVETAGSAFGVGVGFETHVFGVEGHSAIFENIAWDAEIIDFLGFVESGVCVAEF